MLANTEDALSRGVEVICEAAFCNYNNYCAADILRKTEAGYDLYEVKDSREVSPQHIKDAGFQYYIISRCKLKIGKIFIVIHGEDEDNPFVPVEVTRQAKGYYRWINDHIWDLNRRQKEPEEIEVEPVTSACIRINAGITNIVITERNRDRSFVSVPLLTRPSLSPDLTRRANPPPVSM